MNIKVLIKYSLLFLIAVGLTACKNDFDKFIVAANTPAVISGTSTGTLSGTDTVVTGTLSITDPDAGEASFQAQTNEGQNYGSFSITADGAWTYTLDNTSSAFVTLNGGETATETVTVSSTDRVRQNITITVTGINDVAVFGSGDGVDSASTTSTNTDPVTGTLTLTDPDSIPDSIVPQLDVATTYGTFSITADGAWTYTVDPVKVAAAPKAQAQKQQALNSKMADVTDVIPVTTEDGLMADVSITIEVIVGNTAAEFSGDITGSVDVGSVDPITGTVVITDPDTDEANIVNSSGAEYGTFEIGAGADAAWSYLLDNTNTAVLAIEPGATLDDVIDIESTDGTMGTITITINGAPTSASSKVAVIRDTTGVDNGNETGELRYNLPAAQQSGRLEVTYDRSATGTDAFLSLLNSSGSTSSGRSILDMRIKTGEFQFRDQSFAVADGVVPTPGTPQTIVVTWTSPDATTPATVTVTVDGTSVVAGGGSFTADARSVANGAVNRVAFRFGSNGNVSADTENYTIEQWEVFSDTEGTSSVFADDFSTYTVGNSLDPNATDLFPTATIQEGTPYNSSSEEVVVEEK